MTRPLRVEFPGAYYHVINRGNAGENVFRNNRDKEKFLEYLAKTVERFSIIVHTYCLMDNHFHILLETPHSNLSRAIQWLNVSYATYFNKKRMRSGHLFQGRFKAILVDADSYLTLLSRYVHLNPVRAHLVRNPADYPFSSYHYFIGKTNSPPWLETGLLEAFGTNRRIASNCYKRFVEEAEPHLLNDPNKDTVGGFILGDGEFVTWVQETFLSDRDEEKEIPQLRKLKPRIELSKIIQAICKTMECSEEEILEKGHQSNLAREMAICLARDLCDVSGKELGFWFGGVSGAAITMIYRRFTAKLEQDRSLKTRVTILKEGIVKI